LAKPVARAWSRMMLVNEQLLFATEHPAFILPFPNPLQILAL
jgi:hypothetical protein